MTTVSPVYTVIVRVWLPDRPGALGQVASRIGAVRGDLLDIEVLEVGGGRAIDELVVALPDETLVNLMVAEIYAIDGVSIEHVRPIVGDHTDGGSLALLLAAELAETEPGDRLPSVVASVGRLTESAWVMVVRGTEIVASAGEPPSADWVNALLTGSRHLGHHSTSGDLFWSDLPSSGLWLASGRPDRPIHERERVRLDLFARIADSLLT